MARAGDRAMASANGNPNHELIARVSTDNIAHDTINWLPSATQYELVEWTQQLYEVVGRSGTAPSTCHDSSGCVDWAGVCVGPCVAQTCWSCGVVIVSRQVRWWSRCGAGAVYVRGVCARSILTRIPRCLCRCVRCGEGTGLVAFAAMFSGRAEACMSHSGCICSPKDVKYRVLWLCRSGHVKSTGNASINGIGCVIDMGIFRAYWCRFGGIAVVAR